MATLSVVLGSTAYAVAAATAGYWIAHRVPDERAAYGKYLALAHVAASLCLFAFWPWWQASLAAGASLIGWIPALVAYAFVIANPASLASVVLLGVLGVFTGIRWRLDEQNPWVLALGMAALTLFAFGITLLQ